jgi:Winged helix-turn helix
MAVLSMSKQEFSRLEVLLRVQSGQLRVADACALIGLHRRQVFRLLRNLERDGATSLLSKRRGKPSNHRPLLSGFGVVIRGRAWLPAVTKIFPYKS